MPTAIAIAAHPDDIEFLMSGTLMRLKDAGYELHYWNLANGCCGSTQYGRAATAKVRREEGIAAANYLGATFHESICDDLAIYYDAPTLANYTAALTETRLGLLYVNSIVTASLTCAALIVLIIFGGYAMARFRFPGRAIVLALFLLAQVLPHVVMILPVFSIFKAAGLIDTRAALVVTYVAILLPFAVMTMRGFFESIPVDRMRIPAASRSCQSSLIRSWTSRRSASATSLAM